MMGLCFCAVTLLPSWALASGNGSGDEESIIVTESEIQAIKAHKMADLLNHVPGVTAGDTSVSIHGSYKVKVLVNGRSINDPTSSHGKINWEMVSPEEVMRIEIHRGKGGVKYGQDASGGVILITTRNIDQLTGNLKTYGGSEGTAYGHLNLQKRMGKWGVGLSAGGERTDGYKVNNDKVRWKTGTRLDYTLDDKKKFTFTADYLDDERGLSGQPDYPTPFSRKATENTALSFQAQYHNIIATTTFNEGFNHNTDISKNLDKTLRVRELEQNISASFQTPFWGDVSLGGAISRGWASGTSFDDQEEERFSLFFTYSLKMKKTPLALTLGLRGNVNEAFDNATNPEIKLSWKRHQDSQWRLTAAYSRSNNTPSFYRRYNQSSTTLPNPDLTMETADNYSIALFMNPMENFSGSLSFFYNRLEDRITYLMDDEGVGQYQNFGLVSYTGGDIAVTWKPTAHLKINGSYTYLEAVDENTDLWITAKAKHTGKFDVYWHPVERLSLQLRSKAVSKVYRNKNNTRTEPGYAISDLRMEYAFSSFTLFGETRNMFDAHYTYADGLTAPPLTWFVGVNVKI